MTENKENIVINNQISSLLKHNEQEKNPASFRRPLVTIKSIDLTGDVQSDVSFAYYQQIKQNNEFTKIKVFEDQNLDRNENTKICQRKIREKDESGIVNNVLPSSSRVEVNIKASSKKTHSHEVSKSFPGRIDRVTNTSLSHGRLRDSLRKAFDTSDALDIVYRSCVSKTYAKDIFRYLVHTEKIIPADPMISSVVRSCIINWLLKINGVDGEPGVVQTACWYLDSLLATGPVPLDKLQLVGAACYWLAQKLLGPSVTASNLVKCSNHAFTRRSLFQEEKIVLVKLNFPSSPVVVQDYLGYLCWWCEPKDYGGALVASTFLYTCGLMLDKTLCRHWPSVSGAAAVETTLQLLGEAGKIPTLRQCPAYTFAHKKSGNNIPVVCKFLIKAVSIVSSPRYEYKAPLEIFGFQPNCIAQKIVDAVNNISNHQRQ